MKYITPKQPTQGGLLSLWPSPSAQRAGAEGVVARTRAVRAGGGVEAAKLAQLFDYLVGAEHCGGWQREAESFGGFEIDDQFEFGRLLDRQI